MLKVLIHDLLWALLLLTPMKIAVLLAMLLRGKRESRVVAGFWGLLIGAVVVAPGWYWLALSWREKTIVEGIPGLITAVVELIDVGLSVVFATGIALILSATLGARPQPIRSRWLALPAALYGGLLVTALVLRWPVYQNESVWQRADASLGQVRLQVVECEGGQVRAIGPSTELFLSPADQRQVAPAELADRVVAHRSLRSLRLERLQVTDVDLQKFGQLQDLTMLEVDSDLVTDKGVAALGGLSRLSHLTLQCPAVTDAGMTTLAQLKELEYLNIEGVPITDQGLRQLRGLPRLDFIVVDTPNLSREGLEEFKQSKFGVTVGLPDDRDPVTGMSLGERKLPSREELQRKQKP